MCLGRAIREEFKRHIAPFVEDSPIYGTGAAPNPFYKKRAEGLLDKHAGWKCSKTKWRYMKYPSDDLSLWASNFPMFDVLSGDVLCLAQSRFPILFFPLEIFFYGRFFSAHTGSTQWFCHNSWLCL